MADRVVLAAGQPPLCINTTEILGELSSPIFSGFALFKLFEE